MYDKPDDPSKFIVNYLEKVKVDGLPPLLKAEDIDAMFGMLDVTNKGSISVEQANNVAKSVIGPNADLGLSESVVSKEVFIQVMLKAIV